MTQSDYGRVGGLLKRQYQYLDNFAKEIGAGKLSQGQVETRSKMYINSSTQAFERGKASTLGLPQLPAYPGDGQTRCRTNCKCNWRIIDKETHWECTWNLNPAEHCDDCLANAARWNPLVIPK